MTTPITRSALGSGQRRHVAPPGDMTHSFHDLAFTWLPAAGRSCRAVAIHVRQAMCSPVSPMRREDWWGGPGTVVDVAMTVQGERRAPRRAPALTAELAGGLASG